MDSAIDCTFTAPKMLLCVDMKLCHIDVTKLETG